MKKIRIILGLVALVSVACTPTSQPQDILSSKEIDSIKTVLAPYVSHLPLGVKEENKLDDTHKTAYAKKAKFLKLSHFYKGESDTFYFEIQQMARSLQFKKVATGGKYHVNSLGEMDYYEEVYRTWKMDTLALEEKSKLFFHDMIHHKDLSQYYTAKTNDTEHIEFPNENTIFNKETRKWESSLPILTRQ